MKAALKELFGELAPWGRVWLVLGLLTLSAAALMSWSFGREISIKHALFLLCLTFVAAFLPDAAVEQWTKRRYGMAVVLGFASFFTLAVEYYTHAGYTAGLRGYNIETAQVQNAKYDSRQDELKDEKASLTLWETRLAALSNEHAWAATVTADALRARLAGANLAIEQEARRGGCKSICLARTKERDEISARIAIAEEKSDLTKKIEATKRVLASVRDKAATTEHKSSAVVHQNEFLAGVVALVGAGSLEPDAFTRGAATQSVNLGMALAGTGLPALCFLVMGLHRRRPEGYDAPSRASMKAVIGAAGNALNTHTREVQKHFVSSMPMEKLRATMGAAAL